MKILITGGCGFLGSNLSSYALKNHMDLMVFDNLSRLGASENLSWLKNQGKFKFFYGDIRSPNDIAPVISKEKPDVIFHVAGQVAMTSSVKNPRQDFETNALGAFNLLEAARQFSADSAIIYSSTNKVYGDLKEYHYTETDTRYICDKYPKGFPENIPLSFHSPYGCSKGTADQYMLDYARMYGLNTIVFRHSSMYGGRQFATYDQGWIGWFCQKALEIKRNSDLEPFTVSGTGKQVRDVLYADDMIRLYFTAADNAKKAKGQAFNIGGGYENSLSLLELFVFLEEELGVKMKYTNLPWRSSDQKVFVADLKKAQSYFDWQPKINAKDGIRKMIEWVDSVC